MKKYLTEFIGAFFLVLSFISCVNNPGIAPMAPLAIGAMMTVMIFAGSQHSGAHYNPAISLAMFMRGKISITEMAPYMLSQIAGAVVAAMIGVFIHRSTGGLEIVSEPNQTLPALLGEILGTFALCYVALNVASRENKETTAQDGLAIGLTLMASMYGLGKLSGGAYNPALAAGICIAGMKSWADIWIYFIGCFGGAAIAATVDKLIRN